MRLREVYHKCIERDIASIGLRLEIDRASRMGWCPIPEEGPAHLRSGELSAAENLEWILECNLATLPPKA